MLAMKKFNAVFDDSFGAVGAEASGRLEFFAFDGVVGNKEVLNFCDELVGDVLEGAHVFVLARFGGDGD